MEGLTFDDLRQPWEKIDDQVHELLQKCTDAKAEVKMAGEVIVKIAKDKGKKFICPHCKKDVTFGYDAEKIRVHFKECHDKQTLNKGESSP